MRKLWFVLSCYGVLLSAFSMLACGTGNRLQSINISPTEGSSQVQFIATGTYTDGSKVTPLPVLWSQNSPWAESPVQAISLDANGMASCLTLAGTFTIQATAPVDPHVPLSKLGPTTPQVYGTATFTCP